MKWFVQTTCIPTDGSDYTGFMVYFDNHRYLFNCGEGSQRIFFENSIKSPKIDNVFVSQANWKHLGGLPGLGLTLSAQGSVAINVCGPKNTSDILNATNLFTRFSECKFNISEFSNAMPHFKDEYLTVFPQLAVSNLQDPAEIKKLKHEISNERNSFSVEPYLNSNFNSRPPKTLREKNNSKNFSNNFPFLNRGNSSSPDPLSKKLKLQQNHDLHRSAMLKNVHSYNDQITNYIILGPIIRGRFNAQKAQALGLKPGPIYKDLIAGNSVATPEGVIIHPDDVVEKPKPRDCFIFIDCPSEEYVDSIVENKTFGAFFEDPVKSETLEKDIDTKTCLLRFVLHSVSSEVLSNEKYIEWMKKFPGSVKHVISSKNYSGNVNPFRVHAALQSKLSLVDDGVFIKPPLDSNKETLSGTELSGLDIVYNKYNLIINMNPTFSLDFSSIKNYLSYDQIYGEWKKGFSEFNYLTKLIKEYKQTTENTKNKSTVSQQNSASAPSDNFMVATLGTGSSIPSSKRNVMSNLLYIPDYGYALLDVGEGTTSQIKRLLGTRDQKNPYNNTINDTYEDFLDKLKMVYISHLHADHNLGLMALLQDWNSHSKKSAKNGHSNGSSPEPERQLYVMASEKFFGFLMNISNSLDIGMNKINYIFLENLIVPELSSGRFSPHSAKSYISDKVLARQERSSAEKLSGLYKALGFKSVSSCRVKHFATCFGISLTHKDGWQLIYSGDTRPSVDLLRLVEYKRKVENQPLTMLIHESTFDDEYIEDALLKRHSTASEAISVGILSKAENILLNHFSQRYVSMVPYNTINVLKSIRNIRSEQKEISIADQSSEDKDLVIYSGSLEKEPTSNLSEKELDELNEESSGLEISTDSDCSITTDSGSERIIYTGNKNGFVTGSTDQSSQSSSSQTNNKKKKKISKNEIDRTNRLIKKMNIAYAFDNSIYSPKAIRNFRHMVPALNSLLYTEKEFDTTEQ
ncbi:hypothetical protein BB560_000907 [Smittium megazygosporum]|uniref:ribonuclease Z n=1 Tax=Smittium megazygosporum TaxID=133381 RepID=A0A2T9ZJ60_9FUNG|nr:hypothetical protein BB560_000907 [Smittium megazygosporum]